jgi:adenine-specific DNA-methyltransferase
MDLSDLSKDELIEIIKKAESRKKYGLVWEDEKTREHFNFDPAKVLPLISEIKKYRVGTKEADGCHYLIEGDNFFALNILRYTHSSRIDLIYIDPPYNTGNKEDEEGFVYNDKRVDSEDSYRHSKWLSFMSKRLELAKDLLTDSGLIFISIDQNEFAQLRLLCDQIFGESNFINYLSWKKRSTGGQVKDGSMITQTEFIFIYAKNKTKAKLNKVENLNSGAEKWRDLRKSGGQWQKRYRPKQYFPFFYDSAKNELTLERTSKNQIEIYPQDSNGEDGFWENGIETARTRLINGEFRAEMIKKGSLKGHYKIKQLEIAGDDQNVGNFIDLPSVQGANEIKKLGLKFNNPKPLGLIEHILTIGSPKDGLVLDFFAGSGTTGHAVLSLNSSSNANRKFILVTNNENNICEEVTLPRIKKAIKGYNEPNGYSVAGLGGNMRYFKTKFIEKSLNSDEMKMRATENCIDLLCFREGIFEEMEYESSEYRVFKDGNRVLAIYHSFDPVDINKLRDKLNLIKSAQKKAYVFTFDNDGLYTEDYDDWEDVEVEAIPQKILEILGAINV